MAKKPPKVPTGAKLKRYLANPGLRSTLPNSALSPEQLRLRQAIQLGRQPITPGSSITNRDLARQTHAAVQTAYGPQEQGIQAQIQAARAQRQDTSDYFAQYQQALAAHQANIAQIQAQGQQRAAVADTTSDPNSATNQQAAAIRGQLASSYQGLANQLGTNANSYADTLSNVVAPGQRLTGMQGQDANIAAVLQKLTDLKGTEGSAAAKYKDDAVQNEAKNVLAEQIAGVNAQTKAADLSLKQQTLKTNAELKREQIEAQQNSPSAQKTKAELAYFEAHGYYPPTGPPKTAKSKSQWSAPAAQGKAQDAIGSAQASAQRLKDAGKDRHTAAQYLLTGEKGKPVYETVKTATGSKQQRKLNKDGTPVTTGAIPKTDQVWASVALDLVYDGHVSKYNVGRLHARGIKINALGVPTKAVRKKAAQAAPAAVPSPFGTIGPQTLGTS